MSATPPPVEWGFRGGAVWTLAPNVEPVVHRVEQRSPSRMGPTRRFAGTGTARFLLPRRLRSYKKKKIINLIKGGHGFGMRGKALGDW